MCLTWAVELTALLVMSAAPLAHGSSHAKLRRSSLLFVLLQYEATVHHKPPNYRGCRQLNWDVFPLQFHAIIAHRARRSNSV